MLTMCSTMAEEYASYVFLIDESGGVRPIPHALYVALARAEASSSELAGGRFRVADWHVRLRGGMPEAVVREWYGWAGFRPDGTFDPAPNGPQAAGNALQQENIDASALPTHEERRGMMEMLFPPVP